MALTYGQARRILMEWHGGQGSAVYSVGSSGKMAERQGARDELDSDRRLVVLKPYNHDDPTQAVAELDAVIEWLDHIHEDIPRDKWIRAWDETPV